MKDSLSTVLYHLSTKDLSKTVGIKSYPIPSTLYDVTSVLFNSSGCANIDPIYFYLEFFIFKNFPRKFERAMRIFL